MPRDERMDFGEALRAMKFGAKCRRIGWNGEGIYIAICRPKSTVSPDDMTGPFIYIDTYRLKSDNVFAPRCRVPWLASQTDMLADDWEIYDE